MEWRCTIVQRSLFAYPLRPRHAAVCELALRLDRATGPKCWYRPAAGGASTINKVDTALDVAGIAIAHGDRVKKRELRLVASLAPTRLAGSHAMGIFRVRHPHSVRTSDRSAA
jgi:hypothetical protein